MISVGDSVYVRSKGWLSSAIAYVSSGGNTSREIPSHEARVSDVGTGEIVLTEVVFKGKRKYFLRDYIEQGAKVWVKRDEFLNEKNIPILLDYLRLVTVKKYDWGLIVGFLGRAILRKLFSKYAWNWVTKLLDKKKSFVCSEYQNAGRRDIGMNVKENETPFDNFRKIPAKDIVEFNAG